VRVVWSPLRTAKSTMLWRRVLLGGRKRARLGAQPFELCTLPSETALLAPPICGAHKTICSAKKMVQTARTVSRCPKKAKSAKKRKTTSIFIVVVSPAPPLPPDPRYLYTQLPPHPCSSFPYPTLSAHLEHVVAVVDDAVNCGAPDLTHGSQRPLHAHAHRPVPVDSQRPPGVGRSSRR
jgi:hypothetical protein